MRSRLLVLMVVCATFPAGCRQADGPLPVSQGEVPNRLDDITRDLVSSAAGDRQAPADLADDLSVFAEARGDAAARALSLRVGEAIAGSQLKEESARKLAEHLWTAVAGRELSERQVEALQDDVRGLLVSAGVTESNADGVAAQIGEVQKNVTVRSRHWYERF